VLGRGAVTSARSQRGIPVRRGRRHTRPRHVSGAWRLTSSVAGSGGRRGVAAAFGSRSAQPVVDVGGHERVVDQVRIRVTDAVDLGELAG
jgi:hypothetical protein